MAHSAPAISFGMASAASWSTDTLTGLLSTLEKHNVKELDTASLYKSSEETLGKAGAPTKFTISTKAPGFKPGSLAKQSILDGMDKSLKDLGVNSVDIYYFHCPDPTIPIEESLSAINELFAAGKFKRFGLSNFKPSGVQEIYDLQSKSGSVLPSVFQGNYNAVSRHIETDLFPLLRKLKISFYAYSQLPEAFVKDSATLRASKGEGRWTAGETMASMYTKLYGKEPLYDALDEWAQIAKDSGISKAALAYRWIAFHSALKKEHGDAIIVGASKPAQLEESLNAIESGPLDAKIAERASAIWKKVENDAPLDNYHSYMAVKQ